MENKIKEVKESNSNAFSYTGDIHVKVVEDDRIYYDNYFHNHGTKKLFNFFIDALIGNYTVAKSSRPCKIILFEKTKNDIFQEDIAADDTATKVKFDWSREAKVSSAVYYDSTALPGIGDNSGSVTYHFRIPFLALKGGATVKKIGLYPNIISSEENDLCAYYIFPENEGIEIPTDVSNYTIIIEWTLTINNAK